MLCCTKKTSKREHNNAIETSKMLDQPSFQNEIDDLKDSMIAYKNLAQPQYSKLDIENCVKILENYISEIESTQSRDEAMKIVESTVLKLNELNIKAGSDLISTGEREKIATIIISATHKKGYNSMDEDITYEWRDW